MTTSTKNRWSISLAAVLAISFSAPDFASPASGTSNAVDRIYAAAWESGKDAREAQDARQAQDDLVDRLAALGASAVPDLISYLAITRGDGGKPAAVAIGKIGSKAVPILLDTIASSPWNQQKGIANALAAVNEPALEPVVARLGEEADPTVRLYLMSAISDMKNPGKYQYMESFLTDDYWPVRSTAVRLIGEGGDLTLIDRVLESMEDADRDVRRRACTAMAAMISRAKVYAASSEADSAVGKTGLLRQPQAQAPEPQAPEPESEDPLELYRSSLVKALDDPYFGVRQAAADGLVSLGRSSLESLLERFSSENPATVILAARSVAAIDEQAALKPLAGLLDHSDRFVRGLAAKLLGESALPRARRPLTEALKEEEDETVRSQMEEALARCEEKHGATLM